MSATMTTDRPMHRPSEPFALFSVPARCPCGMVHYALTFSPPPEGAMLDRHCPRCLDPNGTRCLDRETARGAVRRAEAEP